MTKSLTEKWKDGTIKEGLYFIKTKHENCYKEETDMLFPDRCRAAFSNYPIVEVLAPVPSYERLQEMEHDKECLKLSRNKVSMLEEENKKLKKDITEFKVRLLDLREARDNATKVANTFLCQNADLSKKVHILNEAGEKKYNELCAEIEKNKKLQEQLKEANELIADFRTYDFTINDENAEEYQVKYGIAGEKIYTNKKPSKEFERWRKKITKSFEKKLKSGV